MSHMNSDIGSPVSRDAAMARSSAASKALRLGIPVSPSVRLSLRTSSSLDFSSLTCCEDRCRSASRFFCPIFHFLRGSLQAIHQFAQLIGRLAAAEFAARLG